MEFQFFIFLKCHFTFNIFIKILGIPNIPTPEEMSMLQYNNEEDLGLEPLDTSVLESNNDVPMNADSSNVEPSRTVP